MALKHKVTAVEYAALAEVIRAEYAQDASGDYVLSVEGIDTADNLKGIIAKEKEARRLASERATQLEQQLASAEEERLKKANEYKTLFETEKARAKTLADQLNGMTQKEQTRIRQDAARAIAAGLTKDSARAALIVDKIMGSIKVEGDAVAYLGENGAPASAEILSASIKTAFPFLVDGSGASGGGATGSKNAGGVGRTITRKEFDAMPLGERGDFIRTPGNSVS